MIVDAGLVERAALRRDVLHADDVLHPSSIVVRAVRKICVVEEVADHWRAFDARNHRRALAHQRSSTVEMQEGRQSTSATARQNELRCVVEPQVGE